MSEFGSIMSSAEFVDFQVRSGNGTSGGAVGALELDNRQFALKVFSITAASLTLMMAAALCCRAWRKRSRQRWRAWEYETNIKANSSSPGTGTGLRRLINLQKSLGLMRRRESFRHCSQVYFIYSNLAIAEEDLEEPEERPTRAPLPTNHSASGDTKSGGVILNPCVLYM